MIDYKVKICYFNIFCVKKNYFVFMLNHVKKA